MDKIYHDMPFKGAIKLCDHIYELQKISLKGNGTFQPCHMTVKAVHCKAITRSSTVSISFFFEDLDKIELLWDQNKFICLLVLLP